MTMKNQVTRSRKKRREDEYQPLIGEDEIVIGWPHFNIVSDIHDLHPIGPPTLAIEIFLHGQNCNISIHLII